MNVADIAAELSSIHDEQIDTDQGAHWARIVEEFNCRHPDARYDVGAGMFDEWLKTKALKVMQESDRRAGKRQLTLPGIDAEWDATVTVPDGEGSFRRKRLERATASDLEADLAILEENLRGAIDSTNRGRQRNQVLLPVMDEHAFPTAGEAIEYLSGAR